MKVVMIGTRGFPNVQGGVENHCENLAANLVRLGCEVIVFTRKSYVDNSIKEYKGVKLVSLPTVRHKTFEAFFHTFFAIVASLRYNPDIVHIHGIGPGFFAWLSRMFGKKVVLTSHGSNYKHLKWNKVEKIILKLFERMSFRWSNVIIAVSGTIANEIKKNYNKDAVMIPNGVNLLQPVNSIEELNELNIKERKYILSVGRLAPEKGFHDLITAFCELNMEDWHLVIVGDTGGQSDYRDFLLKKAQNNKIIFTGFLTGISLQELYSHAGLFILPSYYEGLAISLLEAMSFGLTCIASNIEGNKNINLPGENYFEVGNIDSLKATILKFINIERDDTEITAQINYIKENFSWDKIVGLILEMYKKV